ncbi:MAG: 50S ribosomal protein L25 [Patescibacteria group bacterium]
MLSLNAEARTLFGKKVKKLRAEGKIPLVAYGKKGALGSYSVGAADFKKLFREAGESTVVNLITPEGERDVLIHDISYDPVTNEVVHADLYVIEKGQKVQVKVQVEFTGTSYAVKSLSGVLVKVLYEVEVEAEPRNLPHVLTIDISKLATFEDKLHASDIALPAGVILIENPEEVIALVQAPKEEKEEEAVPVDLTAIEVEKKGKKEEEVIGEPEATKE